MGTPANNPEGYRDSSVLTRAERLRGRLLLVHGMLDENVHFRHTARLTTALLGAGKPFELLPLPDERHSSRREGDRKYVAERLGTFFEEARTSANSVTGALGHACAARLSPGCPAWGIRRWVSSDRTLQWIQRIATR